LFFPKLFSHSSGLSEGYPSIRQTSAGPCGVFDKRRCAHNGIWILEVGDVQIPTDATEVKVPVYATTSDTTQAIGLHLEIDQTRFELVPDLEASIEGTVSHAEPEVLLIGSNPRGSPAAGILWDFLPPREPEKDLPVGLRQKVFNFIFRTRGHFAEGDTFPVHLFREPGVKGSTSFSVSSVSVAPDLLIGGEIRFGSTGPARVEELEGEIVGPEGGGGGAGSDAPAGTGVRLSWRNGASYDFLRVERNGELVTELPGEASEFVDSGQSGGIFTYKVIGVKEGERSFPATTLVATISPPGAFLRGDANRDGGVNLSDPVATLTYLFRGGRLLPCEDAADADDDGRITVSDPIFTLNFLFRGGRVIGSPGIRYPWFDPTPDALGCAE
jgi:hypothetical protein